jgi:hypothetical protein
MQEWVDLPSRWAIVLPGIDAARVKLEHLQTLPDRFGVYALHLSDVVRGRL